MITYIFRKPKYPIICNIDGYILGAKSEASFLKQLNNVALDPDKNYDLIDISAEGWRFSPNHMAVSPLTMKKKWFKKEIISLYNNRRNSTDGNTYNDKSLSAKRFDKIFSDIIELLKP